MVKRSREELRTDGVESTSQDGRTTVKQLHRDPVASLTSEGIQCQLPPHEPLPLDSYEDFEIHYRQTHVNRCSECFRNFPTEHFLDLHICENHDPIIEARKAKGERTYRCFVEDCDRVCSTPLKRRMHLVDKHLFPKNYDFFIVNDGVDRRTSMLRQEKRRTRQSITELGSANRSKSDAQGLTSTVSTEGTLVAKPITQSSSNARSRVMGSASVASSQSEDHMLTSESSAVDDDMEALISSISALRFVPPSIRFGRGRGGGGFSRS